MAQTLKRRGTRGAGCTARRCRARAASSSPTSPSSTRNSSAPASRCSCCGRSTSARSQARGGLQVHQLLREVPRLGGGPQALDAPDPHRRREAVRRLRRPDRADRRRGHRRDPPRADLRGRAGRVELHLRLCHRDADRGRLGRLDHRRAGVHRRRAAADRARPDARADRAARPLRARRRTGWSRSSAPTTAWRCCRPGPAHRATSPRSKSACRSSSAGSWRGCATGASSAWPSSTRRSASCSPS